MYVYRSRCRYHSAFSGGGPPGRQVQGASQLNVSRPSVREVVGSSLFNRFLIGGPIVQPLGPCVEVRILRALAERSRHLADKAHLNIGAARSEEHTSELQSPVH